jgi:signal peptidase I
MTAVRAVLRWARSVLVALVLFTLVRNFGVEAFKIPTGSMEGTLLVGDFLFVNKLVYGAEIPGTSLHLPALSEPERGDVVVFRPPHDPDRNYVKRIVGIPGDTLEMRRKQLLVNGDPLDEPYVRFIDVSGDAIHPRMRWQSRHLIAAQSRRYRPTRDTWGPIVVPDSSYFMLGDNRDNSEDSRYWGFVPRNRIHGRPWLVYFSIEPARSDDDAWWSATRWDRLGTTIR